MAERLTEYNKTGWVLKLDDPQNEFEARQQLMIKFKLACEKLGKIEDIMQEYGLIDVQDLKECIESLYDESILAKKLKEFKNVMSKYGIEGVEELDDKLANFDNFMKGNKFETIEDLQNAINGKFIEVFDEKNKIWQDMVKNLTKTEQDRDTWKRACELACENMELPFDILIGNKEFDECHSIVDYFYQQAKKEGE